MASTNKILQRFAKDMYLEKVIPGLSEEKAQKFATLALTLTAIAFFGLFAILPTLTTIVNLQKQLEDDKFVDLQLQEKISALSILEQKYAALQDNLPDIYAAVPQTPQSPLLLAQLQGIAATDHVKVARVDTSAPINPLPQSNADQTIDVTVDVDGQQSDLFTYINDVTQFERIFTIDKLLIKQNESTNGQPALATDLHLSIKGRAHFKIIQL